MTGRFSKKTLIVIFLLAFALEIMWILYMTNKDAYSLNKQAGNGQPSQASDKNGNAYNNRPLPFKGQPSGYPRPVESFKNPSPGMPRNEGFRNPPPGFQQEGLNKQVPYDNKPYTQERENNGGY